MCLDLVHMRFSGPPWFKGFSEKKRKHDSRTGGSDGGDGFDGDDGGDDDGGNDADGGDDDGDDDNDDKPSE